ncbi:MAG: DEAD/DEAH box helicase [Liquorilactobacillus ghanensis]|uniref:SNF2-related protein n=1 Tax=Liquorilactobacillus ghanensis TaxID=399370 RepID=UPI0039EAE247
MINWKNMFSDQILKRGQRYFKQKRVENLRYDKYRHAWTAAVHGTRTYRVKIYVDHKGNLQREGCSCPFAAKGYACKHLVAVFCALESLAEVVGTDHGINILPKKKATYNLLSKLQRQVRQQLTADYYFDLNKILANLKINDEVFQRAQQLDENPDFVANQIKLDYVRDPDSSVFSSKREQVIKAVSEHNMIQNAVYVMLGRDRVMKTFCSICYQTDTFCEHTTNLLLHLVTEILKNNPGDYTDYQGSMLLADLKHAKDEQLSKNIPAVDSKKKVSLLPELVAYSNKSLALRLKVGEAGKRLYRVKDLPRLLQDFTNGATVRLGKKQILTLRVEDLTPAAFTVYDFLRRNLLALLDLQTSLEKNDLNDQNLSESLRLPEYGKSALLLGPAALDDFYATFQGKKVIFINRNARETTHLQLTDHQLKLTIELKKVYGKNKSFQGLKFATQIPPVFLGRRTAYYVADQHFHRISLAQADLIKPLLNHDYDDKLTAVIGKQNLAEFYYYYLPDWLADPNINVIQPQLTTDELPPKAEFTFLLDMSKQQLTCRVLVAYHNKQLNLLDSAAPLWYRNRHYEKKVQQQLQTFFSEIDEVNKKFMLSFSDERLYDLLTQVIPRLQSQGTVKVSAALKNISIVSAPKVTVGVKLQGNLVDLSLNSQDFTAAQLQQIFQQYQLKKKFYRLPNGSFVDLKNENLQSITQLQQSLDLPTKSLFTGHNQLGANRAFFLDQCLKNNQVNLELKTDQQFQQLIKRFEKLERQKFPLPNLLQATLRPYQKIGYQWLRTLATSYFGGILADEMGLGKTIQVITLLLANQQEKFVAHASSLIVTPASLVYNWQAELAKFAPSLRVKLITGTQKQRQQQLQALAEDPVDVVITSYDLLKRDLEQYQSFNFAFEIIDEAQYIKNPRTSAAKAVKKIKSQVRFALTGTPIENGLSELWSIFDFLMPGFLGTYHDFRSSFENPIIKEQQKSVQQKLNQLVAPFILRRLKRQVLKDLPEKIEQVYLVEMENKQRTLYQAQTSSLKKRIQSQSEQEVKQSKIQILAGLTKLREICCDPALIFANYQQVSAKRKACLELLSQAVADGHKILIFSQFTSLLKLLAKDLQQQGWDYYELFGTTPKKERIALANKFNHDQVPIFLISLKAGGTGLNLTGADMVIHFDPWWNIAAQNQATDRAHRIGQQNKVNVYSLISKNSIEEKVLQLQQAKKQLADNLLNNQKITSGSLTKQDLLQILQ